MYSRVKVQGYGSAPKKLPKKSLKKAGSAEAQAGLLVMEGLHKQVLLVFGSVTCEVLARPKPCAKGQHK